MDLTVTIDCTSFSTATIGTNGLIQFGTTTGANPTTNTALPSSSFPNPTLFWYWDDLQTFSSNIQYATVGTSPNRTFIVDFQENRVGDTGNVINGQVQIHEGSNVMNVKYRSTMSSGANGQSATIGFQGAGGASATAYPLTFNGKILDDNLPDAGWSVSPLPICGNGILETKESCDDGANNGTTGSCCTSTCTFKTSGTQCRASAGQCDVAETCTGSSSTCPNNAFASSSTSCTGASQGGGCDNDAADHCTGTSNVCVDVFQTSGTQCRASAGQCDVAETCSGSSGACPADGFASSATSCTGTSQGGACDGADHCSGTSNTCVDVFLSAGTQCRASAGQCDVAETCSGSSGTSPAVGFAS